MKLYLVRHTDVALAPNTCYGQLDAPLKSPFNGQFNDIKRRLKHHIQDAFEVISSPLQRCTDLANHLSTEYRTHHALKEISFGDWEGRLWSDIGRNETEKWTNDILETAPPNGESYEMFRRRIIDFCKQELGPLQTKHLIIVTHGGVIRCMRSYVEKIPLLTSLNIAVPYGSIYRLSFP